ncbi:Cyanovirin-N [Mycena belliarum]|uniref:Cyanovirin-N n=1 Tax=Mycena belliarum TaxID=1033014 RepID=A0AAD6U6U5_9AGAR|nr:Cyanovirin-N [Mycena belliae]
MSFAATSHFYRLEGTYLRAQCKDQHGHVHESTLNLDEVLGNSEGRFDPRGSGFAGSASMYGLNGHTLVARLRSSDGNHHDAHIDLNSCVRNDNGRLERA